MGASALCKKDVRGGEAWALGRLGLGLRLLLSPPQSDERAGPDWLPRWLGHEKPLET